MRFPLRHLIQAICLLLCTPALVAKAATPFRCEGPFGRDANHAKLVATFGADNVASEYDGLYDAEVTIIYPKDPKRRLKLLWKDQKTHRGLRTVTIAGPSSWIVTGVTVGMPLVELERLNRGPFRLNDFDGDFPGAIYDWMGGHLHAPLPGGCTFGASVMIKKGNVLDLEAAREAARDGSWLSSNESLRAAKPVVSEISVGFE